MIPVARKENLLITEVGQELIVYDEERNTAHCLNPVAAKVWHYCDGKNTIKDIAQLLEDEVKQPVDQAMNVRELVDLTLEELERFHLIEGYVQQPIDAPNISRRQMVKTATLAGGFVLGSMSPLVKSIVAPTPIMAISGGSSSGGSGSGGSEGSGGSSSGGSSSGGSGGSGNDTGSSGDSGNTGGLNGDPTDLDNGILDIDLDDISSGSNIDDIIDDTNIDDIFGNSNTNSGSNINLTPSEHGDGGNIGITFGN